MLGTIRMISIQIDFHFMHSHANALAFPLCSNLLNNEDFYVTDFRGSALAQESLKSKSI